MIIETSKWGWAGVLCLGLVWGCSSKPGKSPVVKEGVRPAAKEGTMKTPAAPKDIYTALSSAAMKIQAGDRVCIVCNEGKKVRDAQAARVAEDALRRIVTQRDKAAVIETSAPPLASMLDAHLGRPDPELSEKDLMDAARKAGATKLVVYRAASVGPKTATAEPFSAAPAAEEPMVVEVIVMDVAAGKVIAAAEAATTPKPAPAGARAYPLRVVEPEQLSRPDVPPRPKPETNLLGRRFRALGRMSDTLGPEGLYNNPDYQELTRTSDQLSPFPFYTGEPTLMVITTTPPNARVFVNGMDTALTPCWLPLEEGDRVSLVKQGYITEEFRVPEKQRSIHIDLRPR